MRILPRWAVLLGLAFFAPAPALANGEAPAESEIDFMAPFDDGLTEKIRQANGECYRCHSERGVNDPPLADMDLAKLTSMVIPSAGYDASGHTGIDCRDCHASGFGAYPHAKPDENRTKPCAECHIRDVPAIERELKRSAHGDALTPAFSCETCHDPHLFQIAKKIGAPKRIVAQDNAACVECHDSAAEMARFKPAKIYPSIDEAHQWLPNTQFHWAAVRCVDCHTPVVTGPGHEMSHEILVKDKAARDCVVCHTQATSLKMRLYRHLASPDGAEAAGFANSYLLPNAYVVGATRNIWLDKASFAILALLAAGIAVHALGRAVASSRRRKHRDD